MTSHKHIACTSQKTPHIELDQSVDQVRHILLVHDGVQHDDSVGKETLMLKPKGLRSNSGNYHVALNTTPPMAKD